MKPDAELNQLAATALMHWKIDGEHHINSQKEKKYALDEYQPLSNVAQFRELADKMRARDYNLTITEPNSSSELYKVVFTKYGESYEYSDKSLTRAGTIAALRAYNQQV
jgi:hypothetical protein